jgi:hypothetical protein
MPQNTKKYKGNMRINNNPAAGGQGEGNRYRAGLFYLDAAGLISVSLKHFEWRRRNLGKIIQQSYGGNNEKPGFITFNSGSFGLTGGLFQK